MDGAAASFVAANSESLSKAFTWDTPPFSFSYWAKSASAPADYAVTIGKLNGGAAGSAVAYTGGAAVLYARGANGAPSVPLTATEWHFIYGEVAADSSVSISLNGGALSTGTAGGTFVPLADFALGLASGGGAHWNGQIDEVAIWSRVLDVDERAELWNSGAGRFYPFP
jgi:hypothetical protein